MSSESHDGTAGPPQTPTDASQDASRRLFFRKWGWPGVALFTALGATLHTHLLFMWPFATPVSNDEGYLAAMALRMMRGHWLPYVDGVSQRGPLLYWITALTMRAGGVWSWMPMRVLGLALALMIVTLVFALGSTLASPMAGGIAAVVSTYFLSHELLAWDGVGVNGEPLAVAFALGAALVTARMQLGPRFRRRALGAFAIGLLSAAAGLSKQMFMLHGAAVGVWILVGPAHEQRPWSRRWREAALVIGGAILPFAIVVMVYAIAGHFGTFVYYFQRYGREVFMAPVTLGFIRNQVITMIDRYVLGVVAIGAVFVAAVVRAVRDTASTAVETNEPASALPDRPETLVALNLLLPGLGLARVPKARAIGVLVVLATVASIVARVLARRVFGTLRLPGPIVTDAAIWCGWSALASVLAVSISMRRQGALSWLLLERLRRQPSGWFAITQALIAFAGACFTFRFFPHYFVEFFPFASIIVGSVVVTAVDAHDPTQRNTSLLQGLLATGIAMLLLVSSASHARDIYKRRETDRWYQDPYSDDIARRVAERTTPNQTIFVWGFRAEIYLSAQRFPASRYVYTVYPAGVVPWFQASTDEEAQRVVPGSREQLIEDLEREHAELIVDAGRSMLGRYMYNVPVFRAYLDRNYCFVRYADGEPIYRRRSGARCPPGDY